MEGAAARPASAPQSQINNHPARRRQGSTFCEDTSMRYSSLLSSLFGILCILTFTLSNAFAQDSRKGFIEGKKPTKTSKFLGVWSSGRSSYQFLIDGSLVIREDKTVIERAVWVTSDDESMIFVKFDPKRWTYEYNRPFLYEGKIMIPLSDTWIELKRVSATQKPKPNESEKQNKSRLSNRP
jgi:hypothetical protein